MKHQYHAIKTIDPEAVHLLKMPAEIPSGGEGATAMEQSQPEPPPTLTTTNEATEKPKPSGDQVSGKLMPKKKKTIVLIGAMVLLAATALLVALIPDWGSDGHTTDTGSSMSGTGNGSSSAKPHNGTSTAKPDNGTSTVQEQAVFFESTQGPFSAKLPLFSSNVTQPYASIEDARGDVEQLARFIVNQAIIEGTNYDPGYFGPPGVTEGGDAAQEDSASSTGDASFGGVDDFETYQQEAGVVKGDYVKSNGELVFAAVQDRLLVWNLQGELLSTTTMPALNVSGQNGGIYPAEGGHVTTGVAEESTTASGVADGSTAAASVRSDPIWWNPKPNIHALLLSVDGTRLTAVVGGYGMELAAAEDSFPVIYDYLATRLIVYDIEGGTLTQISQTDINGSHRNSYSVGDDVHIVTHSSLNTYSYLVEPLSRWNPAFQNMTSDEYEAAATALAEELIPDFVQKILDLFTVDGEIVLARLAVFASSISENSETDLSIFGPGIVNAITEVVSFDMTTPTSNNGDLGLSRSATMQPGSWGFVYATNDWIWVADQSWTWVKDEETYVQETFLLGFKLNDGATSTFATVGSVPGSILNQFAVDFIDDDGVELIRVATTLNFNWGWWGPTIPIDTVDGDIEAQNATVNEAEDANIPLSRTKNQVFILQVPSNDGSSDDSELIQRGSIELGKVNEVSRKQALSRTLHSL
jgi:Beta propeller domain